MTLPIHDRATLTRFAWLSVAAAVATIALKTATYWLTGSVGLLSDALVPANRTVQKGHELVERIENELRMTLTNVTVFTHLEPLDNPISWEDISLDRA